MSDMLENMIIRCIERFMAGRFTERHGLVTSYDPKRHLAKVKFMPEGQESGWLPIETGHIGDGYGIATGLKPGNGGDQNSGGAPTGGSNGGGGGQDQQQQGATGDQVIVRYQEGDFEGGKIVQRVHSDKDKPPNVKSGESVTWTEKGQQLGFHDAGAISVRDGSDGSLRVDGGGAVVGKHKEDKQGFSVNDKRVRIRWGEDNMIWADKDGLWSSKPIQVKDPPKDDFKDDPGPFTSGGSDDSGGQGGGSGQ